MKTFVLTSTRFEGSVEYTFNDEGQLDGFSIQANFTEVQRIWFYERLPTHLDHLTKLSNLSNTMTIEEVDPDLSFDAFWLKYNHKVGNKKRSEMLWNKLSAAHKLKAINAIAKYHRYLSQRPSMEKLYPETYLSQERFLNDYK